MNPNLLSLVEMPTTKIPVMLDRVPASEDSDAGPFLITSSKSVMWVEKAFRGGFLRVAVRALSANDLFRSLVESVASEGALREWGNVLPCTKVGVLKGLAHLSYFGLADPVILYGTDFDISVAADLPRVPADWVPPTWAVMIPADRGFVGTAFLFSAGNVGAVVHNASRGVVVLIPEGGLSASAPSA